MAEETAERKESVKWNLNYFKSCPGYCKLILIVLNLLAFIAASVASSKYTANAQVTIFLFVSMISFWISLFIVCFYLFRFDEKLDSISFSTFGFYYSCVSSIAYLASSLSLIFLGGFLAAACFFGLMAFAVYAIDAYLYYCKINGVTPLAAIIRTGQRAGPPESVTTESK